MRIVEDLQMYTPCEKNAETVLLFQAVHIVTTGL